jgi:hypothetical protein
MNLPNEKRNKKLEMKVNPTYINLLNEIADHYSISNVNTLVDLILTGKHLSRSQSGRDAKKLVGNIASQSTQSIIIVRKVIQNARKKKLPLAVKELAELEAGFKATHNEEHIDVLKIFEDLVEELCKSIGSIVSQNVRYEADTSKEAARFKRRLSEINVNDKLPRRRNYYSRHTASTYALNFKNNGVFKAGERPDAYNRRALKHSLESRAEFMIEHIDTEQFKRAFTFLTEWNDINHQINLSLLEGGSTGITKLFKEIVSLNKKVNLN